MEPTKRVQIDIAESAHMRLKEVALQHRMPTKSLLEKIIAHVTGRADGLSFLNPKKGKKHA